MSVILNDIEDGIKSAIEGIAQADGYNFDWGACNQPDEALQTFPNAEITIDNETCQDDAQGVWSDAYDQEAVYIIRVRARLDNETSIPAYEINRELNKALQDLKKLFGRNYHASDSCDTITYMGMQRVPDKNNDIFRPAHMDVRFRVRYTEDRSNPEINAE
jgi:hypothetical protein